MSRILGRLIERIPTPELAFTIQYLETQAAETISAGGGLHPTFNKTLSACRIALLTRNLNEFPQSMLCGYVHVGAYD